MVANLRSDQDQAVLSLADAPSVYPRLSSVQSLRLLLDDGTRVGIGCCRRRGCRRHDPPTHDSSTSSSKAHLDCSDIVTVSEAKLKAFRMGIIAHLEYVMASARYAVVIADALRLDVIPVVAHDIKIASDGVLDMRLTSFLIDESDGRLNQGGGVGSVVNPNPKTAPVIRSASGAHPDRAQRRRLYEQRPNANHCGRGRPGCGQNASAGVVDLRRACHRRLRARIAAADESRLFRLEAGHHRHHRHHVLDPLYSSV